MASQACCLSTATSTTSSWLRDRTIEAGLAPAFLCAFGLGSGADQAPKDEVGLGVVAEHEYVASDRLKPVLGIKFQGQMVVFPHAEPKFGGPLGVRPGKGPSQQLRTNSAALGFAKHGEPWAIFRVGHGGYPLLCWPRAFRSSSWRSAIAIHPWPWFRRFWRGWPFRRSQIL